MFARMLRDGFALAASGAYMPLRELARRRCPGPLRRAVGMSASATSSWNAWEETQYLNHHSRRSAGGPLAIREW
jgi:hypothetical protein